MNEAEPTLVISDLQDEVWLTIEQNTDYEVSSLGRIRRRISNRRHPAGHLLTPTGNRYLKVILSYGKVSLRKYYLVHRLVAAAFLGNAPSDKHFVNHKNGVKTDNRAANLEWCTPKQNQEHARDVLNRYKSETSHNAKLTTETARAVYLALLNGDSPTVIRDRYKIGKTVIYAIKRRAVWKEATADLPDNFLPVRPALRKGDTHPGSKLTGSDVRIIKRRLLSGEKGAKIARDFNVGTSMIYRIRDGISWKHIDDN